jgi:DnaJ-class molecular chaperone
MKDPYESLGVARTATEEEISAAYKKLARRYHPDLHPDDKAAEARFKEIAGAADLLRDKEKRRRFDAGEIDASGTEQAPRFYRDATDGPHAAPHAAADGFASNEDLAEFLARAFGERGAGGGPGGGGFGGSFGGGFGGGGAPNFKAPGQDVNYELRLAFLDAARGAVRTLNLPDGKTLKVTIPAGSTEGQMLRLAGQGMPGYGGGPPGDAYVELHVDPHAFFRRKDNDIHVDVPVTIREAVLGARIEVPTIDGPVALTVPRNANAGTTLRLRERGVLDRKTGQRGHQFVTLTIVLPKAEDAKLTSFLETWQPEPPENPRAEMLR